MSATRSAAMRRRGRAVATFCGLMLGVTSLAAAGDTHRYADAHLHYVDFFQESDGIEAMLEAMDHADVGHVVLMGIPVAKKWHEDEPKKPRYYQGDDAPLYWYSATDTIVAEAVRALPDEARRRVHPFLSGFNPNDKNSVAHIERMLELYPDVWEGIGEVFTRHDDLSALTLGDTPRANNEAMMRVYRLAAERDLPVLLHANLTSVREREPLYLEEIEDALSKNPETTFVWAHAGTSGAIVRMQGTIDCVRPTVETLLEAHDNLWIDLSWTALDHVIVDGKVDPDWLALVERFPDRFVIGSDLVGRFDSLAEKMRAYDPLLDALPGDVARRVARDNLLALLGD